ncbi:helix-turn-helix domain-containing protein [uncultured Aquimarina sp.]|uniref:helix-turn-helix domain-containing protein n=1 Tax=uncultured Aquimarina sp. TaxID=575652 RepID=UPI00262DBF31|nr:helix-turn-helix domain-containing protein [uncultured Aquimarina sp.]
MFDTEMEPVTFVILVFQVLVLFAQSIIYFSRPDDKSRLRFFLLIITYIFYNTCSGLFPDENIAIPLSVQIILAYGSGVVVSVYFVYYIYLEYDIYPFDFFKIKFFAYTLVSSFILLFIVPYIFYGDLSLSRRLFLGIPIIVALAYLYKVTKLLSDAYKKGYNDESKLFRHRVISGNLALLTLSGMPIVVAFGDYQTIEQSIVNFGFIIMMVTYILDFVAQAQNETIILSQLQKKDHSSQIQMADNILDDILDHLQNFEDKKQYLEAKITINALAKKFNTNSRYLSFIVNKNKGKTFVRYVNDLRIDYLIKRLEQDRRFRNQYTVKGMALEIGFTSSDALGRAFNKSQTMKFSEYLKKVRAS